MYVKINDIPAKISSLEKDLKTAQKTMQDYRKKSRVNPNVDDRNIRRVQKIKTRILKLSDRYDRKKTERKIRNRKTQIRRAIKKDRMKESKIEKKNRILYEKLMNRPASDLNDQDRKFINFMNNANFLEKADKMTMKDRIKYQEEIDRIKYTKYKSKLADKFGDDRYDRNYQKEGRNTGITTNTFMNGSMIEHTIGIDPEENANPNNHSILRTEPIFRDLANDNDLSVKVRYGLQIRFHRPSYVPGTPEEFINRTLYTDYIVMLSSSNYEEIMMTLYDMMEAEIANFMAAGSGWLFHVGLQAYVDVAQYRPFKIGSYIPSYKDIKSKVINVKNYYDDKCMQWSVLAGLNKSIHKKRDETESYNPLKNKVTYPISAYNRMYGQNDVDVSSDLFKQSFDYYVEFDSFFGTRDIDEPSPADYFIDQKYFFEFIGIDMKIQKHGLETLLIRDEFIKMYLNDEYDAFISESIGTDISQTSEGFKKCFEEYMKIIGKLVESKFETYVEKLAINTKLNLVDRDMNVSHGTGRDYHRYEKTNHISLNVYKRYAENDIRPVYISKQDDADEMVNPYSPLCRNNRMIANHTRAEKEFIAGKSNELIDNAKPLENRFDRQIDRLGLTEINVLIIHAYRKKYFTDDEEDEFLAKGYHKDDITCDIIERFYDGDEKEYAADVSEYPTKEYSVLHEHFVYVKSLASLTSFSRSHAKTSHACDKCNTDCGSKSNLENHECDNGQIIQMPSEKKSFLEFTNYKNTVKQPFIIYGDFESRLNKSNEDNKGNTEITHNHELESYAFNVVSTIGKKTPVKYMINGDYNKKSGFVASDFNNLFHLFQNYGMQLIKAIEDYHRGDMKYESMMKNIPSVFYNYFKQYHDGFDNDYSDINSIKYNYTFPTNDEILPFINDHKILDLCDSGNLIEINHDEKIPDSMSKTILNDMTNDSFYYDLSHGEYDPDDDSDDDFIDIDIGSNHVDSHPADSVIINQFLSKKFEFCDFDYEYYSNKSLDKSKEIMDRFYNPDYSLSCFLLNEYNIKKEYRDDGYLFDLFKKVNPNLQMWKNDDEINADHYPMFELFWKCCSGLYTFIYESFHIFVLIGIFRGDIHRYNSEHIDLFEGRYHELSCCYEYMKTHSRDHKMDGMFHRNSKPAIRMMSIKNGKDYVSYYEYSKYDYEDEMINTNLLDHRNETNLENRNQFIYNFIEFLDGKTIYPNSPFKNQSESIDSYLNLSNVYEKINIKPRTLMVSFFRDLFIEYKKICDILDNPIDVKKSIRDMGHYDSAKKCGFCDEKFGEQMLNKKKHYKYYKNKVGKVSKKFVGTICDGCEKTKVMFDKTDYDLQKNTTECFVCNKALINNKYMIKFQNKTQIIHYKCVKNPVTTKKEREDFKDATKCYCCQNKFRTKSDKVARYDQFTGYYIDAVHDECHDRSRFNKSNLTIPVVFHNLKGYDSHHIIKLFDDLTRSDSDDDDVNTMRLVLEELNIDPTDLEISCIPVNNEKYLTFQIGPFKFIDSMQFKPFGLDTLAKNLVETDRNGDKCYDDFKYSSVRYDKKFLGKKGVYPYLWSGSPEYDPSIMPPKSAYYNDLNDEECSDEDYEQAKTIWNSLTKHFGVAHPSFELYHRFYLELDVLLLSDVFESIRDVGLKNYGIDPSYYLSAPGYSQDCLYKYKLDPNDPKLRIELITDPEQYKFCEKSIRGGVSMIGEKRHAIANNKYMVNFDKSKPSKFIVYDDANNLYGYAMCQALPNGNFKWVNDVNSFLVNDCEKLRNIGDNDNVGFIIECDIHTPENLHDKFDSFPLCPERKVINNEQISEFCKQSLINDIVDKIHDGIPDAYKSDDQESAIIEYYNSISSVKDGSDKLDKLKKSGLKLKEDKCEKLVLDLTPKKNYVCHYRYLKYCLEKGMIITKIHRILSFTQSKWMKPYIMYNTNMRAKATNNAEKDMFKLMNNSIFGKTMENVRNRFDFKFCRNGEELEKLVKKATYKSHNSINSNLIGCSMKKEKVKLNKAIFAGCSILDLSKLLMAQYHYEYIKVKYPGNKSRLSFTDTDSFGYEIETNDIFADRAELTNFPGLPDDHPFQGNLFDFSDYPKDHELYCTDNKKVVAKFKDEANGRIILEFIGLRPKMYSLLIADPMSSDSKEKKTCKGVKKSVKDNVIKHEDYKTVIQTMGKKYIEMKMIRSFNHSIHTVKMRKIGLSAYDNKRYLISHDESRSYGHYLN